MSDARFDESYGKNPAENYERFFVPAIGEPLAKVLLSHADVRPNDRVLDVACGTGVVVRLLAQDLELRGALAGLDPNPAMLAVAEAMSSPNRAIQWHQAPAEDMRAQPGSVDVVLCQMGLQFMADRTAALTQMHQVLKGGGRLLLSVPGPLTGVFSLFASALERHVSPQAAGFVTQVFSLHDVHEIGSLLKDAGFIDVTVEAAEHDLKLPLPRQFLWQYIHSTPLAAVVQQAGAEAAAALERELLDTWAEFVRDDVLQHRVRLVVAKGTKAAA